MIRDFVDEKLLTRWRKTLNRIFLLKITPEMATKLVIHVLEKVSAVVSAARVEGFCRSHGFPAYWTKDLERNENKKRFSASSILNNKPDSFEGSTYYLATLSSHVKRFETDPKLMDELASCVISEKLLTKWCNGLEKICSKTLTSATVAKLVLLLLEKVSLAVPTYLLQGFCRANWLPVYWTLDLPWKWALSPSITKVSATYYSATVSEYITRSETRPEILGEPGVDTRDCGEDRTMTLWCEQLEMMFSEAMTPAAATRLVLSVMNDVSRVVLADDLKVFCRRHQLPAAWTTDVAFTERIRNERKSGRTPYIIEDVYYSDADRTYDATTLSGHIKRFKTDPKIIFELASCGNERLLTNWRTTTKMLCLKGLSCAAAVRLVLIVLEKVSSALYSDDLHNFCCHYRVTAYWVSDVAHIQSRTRSAPSIIKMTDIDKELFLSGVAYDELILMRNKWVR